MAKLIYTVRSQNSGYSRGGSTRARIQFCLLTWLLASPMRTHRSALHTYRFCILPYAHYGSIVFKFKVFKFIKYQIMDLQKLELKKPLNKVTMWPRGNPYF